jgi:hypothetical protein
VPFVTIHRRSKTVLAKRPSDHSLDHIVDSPTGRSRFIIDTTIHMPGQGRFLYEFILYMRYLRSTDPINPRMPVRRFNIERPIVDLGQASYLLR